MQEADRAPRQIGRTLHRGIARDYQRGRLVENGRSGHEEAGERLVDDLGAAEKEDVVAPLPDSVEGPVGIVDADRVSAEAPVAATPIARQRSTSKPVGAPSGHGMSNPGLATPPQRMTPPALTRSSTGPARAIAAKPTMTAAASAKSDPETRPSWATMCDVRKERRASGSPGWRCSNSIATVVVPAQIDRISDAPIRNKKTNDYYIDFAR